MVGALGVPDFMLLGALGDPRALYLFATCGKSGSGRGVAMGAGLAGVVLVLVS